MGFQMHKVRKITVDGFWTDRRVEVDFKKDVNFLIGRNGCGKTTIINMLVASLRLDYDTLRTMVFKKLSVELWNGAHRGATLIELNKMESGYKGHTHHQRLIPLTQVALHVVF